MRSVILASVLLAGCASSVTYDYETTRIPVTQSDYAFRVTDASKPLDLDERRIRTAVDQALTAQGMRETSPDEADILIDYRIEDAKRLESTGLTYGVGFGWHHHSMFGISTLPEAREVNEGRLVVDVIDPQKNEVVWRATSRRTLSPSLSSEERNGLIQELVTEMFRNYPPGRGSH